MLFVCTTSSPLVGSCTISTFLLPEIFGLECVSSSAPYCVPVLFTWLSDVCLDYSPCQLLLKDRWKFWIFFCLPLCCILLRSTAISLERYGSSLWSYKAECWSLSSAMLVTTSCSHSTASIGQSNIIFVCFVSITLMNTR